MALEFVASIGPVLPTEGAQLEDVRGTTNAAPAAPAAAATAPIFAAGEVINVVTRNANEQLRVTLCVDRDNANAAGFGNYRITVNGVAVGPTAPGPTGTAQQRTTVIDGILTIAAPGTYAIGAQVTSITDVETVAALSSLVVVANQFA